MYDMGIDIRKEGWRFEVGCGGGGGVSLVVFPTLINSLKELSFTDRLI